MRVEKLGCITAIHGDCMEYMKNLKDNEFDLAIVDLPYGINAGKMGMGVGKGKNAYGSNPMWYIDGDNKNGESKLAGKEFFDTDKDFRITEFLHFCSKMLMKEPKEKED